VSGLDDIPTRHAYLQDLPKNKKIISWEEKGSMIVEDRPDRQEQRQAKHEGDRRRSPGVSKQGHPNNA